MNRKDASDDTQIDFWEEYESAAQWCAARGLKAETGDPLPNLISADVETEIQENIDAFRERVRAYAYARAMGHEYARRAPCTEDVDCDVNPDTLTCRFCGTYHGEPCPTCHRRAFHTTPCTSASPRDISSITEYGMTCPLSRAVRVY